MLRGDGNENGNNKKKKKKSIGPPGPGPPIPGLHVRTYRRTIFAELNLLDA